MRESRLPSHLGNIRLYICIIYLTINLLFVLIFEATCSKDSMFIATSSEIFQSALLRGKRKASQTLIFIACTLLLYKSKKKKKRITYYSVKLQECFFLFDPLSSKDLAGLFLLADCLLMR